MKKGFKLPLVAMLVVTLTLSVISGCGKSSESVSDDTEQKSSGSSNAKDTEKEGADADNNKSGEADPLDKYKPIEGKEYKFTMVSYQKAPVDENAKMVKYWEKKYGVDFDIWNVENANYAEVMNLKLASNEIPDILFVQGTNMLAQWAKQGVLAEIPVEVLKRYAPKAYKMATEASPEVFRIGRVDGKLYGLCQVPQGNLRYSPCVWRGDWLEKLNITELPETLEEYEEAFYRIANEDPDGNGVKDTYGLSNMGMQMIYGAFGLGDKEIWIEKDGRVVYSPVQPEMKQALSLLRKWYKDGVLDPEFITGENTGGYWALSHAFINGRIGFTSQGGYPHWKPILFEGDTMGANRLELSKVNPEAADKLVFTKPPSGPEGKMGNFIGGQSLPVLGNVTRAFGIQMEEEPDRFGKLLSVLDDINWSSKESFLTRNHGIKGEDWEYWNYGEGEAVKALGEAAEDQLYIYRIGGAETFRFFGPYGWPGMPSPREEWAKNNNFDVGILKRATLTTVDAQTKYKTECDKIVDEAFISIITGDKPLDYFEEFVDKWRKAGGDQMEKELNEWHAEFWK